MSITVEDVEHIAELARLELTSAEKVRYASQLSAILGYFDKLLEVDTAWVPPLSHPLDLTNVLRPDQVRESLSTELVLANAPDHADDCFRVPVILEQ